MNQLEWLLAYERAKLNDLLRQLFGYYLVILSDNDPGLKFDCPISQQIVVKTKFETNSNGNALVANWAELPFAPDSMDAIVLSHGIESKVDVKSIIKQLHKVLRHDGKLIVTGFNPARFKARQLAKKYHGRVLNLRLCSSLIKELIEEGFVVETSCHFGYFACKNQTLAKWLDRLCNKFMPSFACGYIILAQKSTLGMLPVSPSWSKPIIGVDKVAVRGCQARGKSV